MKNTKKKPSDFDLCAVDRNGTVSTDDPYLVMIENKDVKQKEEDKK